MKSSNLPIQDAPAWHAEARELLDTHFAAIHAAFLDSTNRAVWLRWRIRAQVDRLAQIWGDTRAAHAYLHKLLNDKFNAGRQRENWLRWEDLTAEPIADLEGLLHPSQLDQLLMTLTARASRASASAPAPE